MNIMLILGWVYMKKFSKNHLKFDVHTLIQLDMAGTLVKINIDIAKFCKKIRNVQIYSNNRHIEEHNIKIAHF